MPHPVVGEWLTIADRTLVLVHSRLGSHSFFSFAYGHQRCDRGWAFSVAV